MWLKPDLLGPQRNCPQPPVAPARLHAQWRQAEDENREAIEVRKQWMRLLGCSEEEIAADVAKCFDLELVEEIEQLSAALRLAGMCRSRKSDFPQGDRLPF